MANKDIRNRNIIIIILIVIIIMLLKGCEVPLLGNAGGGSGTCSNGGSCVCPTYTCSDKTTTTYTYTSHSTTTTYSDYVSHSTTTTIYGDCFTNTYGCTDYIGTHYNYCYDSGQVMEYACTGTGLCYTNKIRCSQENPSYLCVDATPGDYCGTYLV